MYRIRYFIEDYWKWILLVVVIMGVIFTLIKVFDTEDKNDAIEVVDVSKDKTNISNGVKGEDELDGKKTGSKKDEFKKDEKVIDDDVKESTVEDSDSEEFEYATEVNFKKDSPKLSESNKIYIKYKDMVNNYDVSQYETDLGAYVIAPFYYESLDKKISCIDANNENADDCLYKIISSGKYNKFNSKDKDLVRILKGVEEEYKMRLGYAKSIASDDTINISDEELKKYKESINNIVVSIAMKLDSINKYKQGKDISEIKVEFSESKILGDSSQDYFYDSFINGGSE